jgi:hypothetical protein
MCSGVRLAIFVGFMPNERIASKERGEFILLGSMAEISKSKIDINFSLY